MNYFAYSVDEITYQKVLAKSFEINQDPTKDGGYSTFNESTSSVGIRTDYIEMLKRFNIEVA